jgi:hypothetical protein
VVVGIDEYHRAGEREVAAARWRAFLDLSAALRAGGGLELDLPPRTTRPSPFDRLGRVTRRR